MSQLGSIFFSSESWTYFQQSCQILIEGFRLNLRIWPYFQRVYIHLIKEGPSLFLLQVYFGGVQRFVVYFKRAQRFFFFFKGVQTCFVFFCPQSLSGGGLYLNVNWLLPPKLQRRGLVFKGKMVTMERVWWVTMERVWWVTVIALWILSVWWVTMMRV